MLNFLILTVFSSFQEEFGDSETNDLPDGHFAAHHPIHFRRSVGRRQVRPGWGEALAFRLTYIVFGRHFNLFDTVFIPWFRCFEQKCRQTDAVSVYTLRSS